MIFIKNSQRKIKLDTEKIEKNIQKMLSKTKYSDFELNVWFTTNKTIQKYNYIYRKKNKPTNILSFPFNENIKPNITINPKLTEEKILGDIIISVELALKESNKLSNLPKHINYLLAHGICHLLGHNHKAEKDYKAMSLMEKKLIN